MGNKQKDRLCEADRLASSVYEEILNGHAEQCLQEAANLQVTVNSIVWALNELNNGRRTNG